MVEIDSSVRDRDAVLRKAVERNDLELIESSVGKSICEKPYEGLLRHIAKVLLESKEEVRVVTELLVEEKTVNKLIPVLEEFEKEAMVKVVLELR